MTQIQKLLFVHTPKAAGVHIMDYFRHQLDYPVLSSEKQDKNGVWEDYTIAEHLQFIDSKKALFRTHTLAYGWHDLAYCIPHASKDEAIDTIQKFKDAGWFTFTFVRHPGELLCSFYHYVYGYHNKGKQEIVDVHCPVVERSIDTFVSEHCARELLPSYWQLFDFIGEANDDTFKLFFKHYFNHDFLPGTAPAHASGSKGYTYYCKNGLISKTTQAKVDTSASTQIYTAIIHHVKDAFKEHM